MFKEDDKYRNMPFHKSRLWPENGRRREKPVQPLRLAFCPQNRKTARPWVDRPTAASWGGYDSHVATAANGRPGLITGGVVPILRMRKLRPGKLLKDTQQGSSRGLTSRN